MEIIVPAAGRSSRFPGMKPKFLLFDYQGEMMLKKALNPYIGKCSINVGVLKEHVDKYAADEFVRGEIPGVNLVILPEPTTGPAHTVANILTALSIGDGPIMIRDCDSFFSHGDLDANYICVSKIPQHETLNKIESKSFVHSNDQGIVTDIIEKRVISDTFCVGAYKFSHAATFTHCYNELVDMGTETSEIFVSHIISRAIHAHGDIFFTNDAVDYVDVGTADDWFKHNNKPTIFCDVDGTVIKSQGRYGPNNYYSDPEILVKNVRVLLAYLEKGGQIIFTTARPPEAIPQTKAILENLGFRDCALIGGLHNARRILINDFNAANPFPRAEAINIRRDADDLSDFFELPK